LLGVRLSGDPGELKRLTVILEQLSDGDLRHDIGLGWAILKARDGCG
jgi:hypothetical protein